MEKKASRHLTLLSMERKDGAAAPAAAPKLRAALRMAQDGTATPEASKPRAVGEPCEKILMIDDEAELCEEIGEILTDEGYRVTVINDALKGSAAACEGNYDLLLLDLKMAGLGGLDILKSLRDLGVNKPALVVTGNPLRKIGSGKTASSDDPEQWKTLFLADDVVNKPFDVARLLALVADRLRGA
jgi:CheY-like chemotaxis protein